MNLHPILSTFSVTPDLPGIPVPVVAARKCPERLFSALAEDLEELHFRPEAVVEVNNKRFWGPIGVYFASWFVPDLWWGRYNLKNTPICSSDQTTVDRIVSQRILRVLKTVKNRTINYDPSATDYPPFEYLLYASGEFYDVVLWAVSFRDVLEEEQVSLERKMPHVQEILISDAIWDMLSAQGQSACFTFV